MRAPLVMLLAMAIGAGCATTRPKVTGPGEVELLGSRRGEIDVYFLGLGAHTDEDVFRNEVLLARDRMRERFNTAGRELVLINSVKESPHPHANLTNLKHALAALGTAMDNEDVLVLYIASHGRRRRIELKHASERRLERLRPAALRHYLDTNKIERRLIFISACFAGSFIEDLRSPDTVIFTASSHRRPSFGCKPDRELTFFGKALLQDAWDDAQTLEQIFEEAKLHIAAWEQREGVRSSEPQLDRGERLGSVLDSLRDR